MLQGERDEAVCRAKKAAKQVDKLSAQLADARSQIAEVKAQLAEAVEYIHKNNEDLLIFLGITKVKKK